MSQIFICDDKNEVFRTWVTEKEIIDKELEQERDFLLKRAEALKDRSTQQWDILWVKLQAAGVIPISHKRADYGMEYNPDTKQCFISKRENGSTLDKLLEHLGMRP